MFTGLRVSSTRLCTDPATGAVGHADRNVPDQSVGNGDGVRVSCGPGRENPNVRLHCIDAPETDQGPWGSMATRHLENLLGPTFQLEVMDTDRYTRTIGRLVSEGVDLNRRLVFDGMAAVYPQ